jgi:hypothetical protein
MRKMKRSMEWNMRKMKKVMGERVIGRRKVYKEEKK